MRANLPITVLLAVRNESANITRCLHACGPAQRVIVLDSQSTDGTCEMAVSAGAEVIQYTYGGSYPKKRQWALDSVDIDTDWILLLDADEVIPDELWDEIEQSIGSANAKAGYLIRKGFHFSDVDFVSVDSHTKRCCSSATARAALNNSPKCPATRSIWKCTSGWLSRAKSACCERP